MGWARRRRRCWTRTQRRNCRWRSMVRDTLPSPPTGTSSSHPHNSQYYYTTSPHQYPQCSPSQTTYTIDILCSHYNNNNINLSMSISIQTTILTPKATDKGKVTPTHTTITTTTITSCWDLELFRTLPPILP